MFPKDEKKRHRVVLFFKTVSRQQKDCQMSDVSKVYSKFNLSMQV